VAKTVAGNANEAEVEDKDDVDISRMELEEDDSA
jgi:hypothetical protein